MAQQPRCGNRLQTTIMNGSRCLYRKKPGGKTPSDARCSSRLRSLPGRGVRRSRCCKGPPYRWLSIHFGRKGGTFLVKKTSSEGQRDWVHCSARILLRTTHNVTVHREPPSRIGVMKSVPTKPDRGTATPGARCRSGALRPCGAQSAPVARAGPLI